MEGARLVAEAEAGGWSVETVFCAPGTNVGVPSGAASIELAPGVIERVSDVETPQGCIAIVRRPATTVPQDATFVVIAAGVADPGNLGTIVRSAEAAGADAVIVTPGSADAFSPKTIRASAGAVFHVPVIDGPAVVPGLVIIGTSSHEGQRFDEADLKRPLALVLGNEAHGIAANVTVDETVSIPHAGRSESLNVAMAATVLCFEVARQRRG